MEERVIGRMISRIRYEWFTTGLILSIVIMTASVVVPKIWNESHTDTVAAQPNYVIGEIVPGKVVMVKIKADVVDQVYPFSQDALVAGVAKVCEDFDIKDSLPIASGNSVTTAVILFVEPKAQQ